MITAISSTKGVVTTSYEEKYSDSSEKSNTIANNFRMEQLQKGKDSDAIKKDKEKDTIKSETESVSNSNKANYDDFAKKLKTILNNSEFSLEFKLDDDTKKMILRIIDNNTKEVVHQYPPDLTLKIARMVTSALGNENGQVADAKI